MISGPTIRINAIDVVDSEHFLSILINNLIQC